jgi:hypothetical protein
MSTQHAPNRRMEVVTLRIEPEWWEFARAVAQSQNRTRCEYVRETLMRALRRAHIEKEPTR